jgi:YD repeat-containing protein
VSSHDARAASSANLSCGASTSYTGYDVLGRVVSSNQQIGGQTYNFSYGYNLDGSLTQEVYPSGRTVVTTYDNADRTITAAGQYPNGNTTYVSAVTYAPQGTAQQWTYANGLATTVSFNSRLQGDVPQGRQFARTRARVATERQFVPADHHGSRSAADPDFQL